MNGRPEGLLQSLTPEARELVPVHLRTAGPAGGLETPSAEPPGETEESTRGIPRSLFATSRFHRSRGYLCHDFHKPISKCFRVKR